ncbi:MAG: S41 family peptidase [Ignavibacteria bacterium]|nr:S41 family peptidase [Ignavibacteria bacterium]MBT8383706.1 S41 family peptidase [Ignavibacteria bacterium]NNJ52489.1 S41 family peptidase [Ignavibacteriaceae bacterium]NNL21376.1 S41 family peptidase [Ignavibacteriaceae bacterium]
MFKKKILLVLTLGFTVIFILGFSLKQGDIYLEISKNLELFSRVYKEISENYVDEVDPEQFMRAGIQGMLSSLDPYTIFVDEKKMDDIDLITNGTYGGIGISIGVRGDNVTIIEVMDGYSAQRQGLKIGDILIEASSTAITAENLDEVSTLVKGEPGTTVELKILRNDDRDTLTFNIVREEVIIKNLTYSGFYPSNGNNVYLKLSNFSRSASDELKTVLKELKEQKEIKSIIIDLRGNPGGLLDIAVDICDKFLPKDQLIVSTRGRDITSEKKYYSVQEPIIRQAKIVVLINGGSASASEIVAGAIQDHDRGIILGTKSFGKGLVQTITPLSYNTSLKITTAKYYTPSGRCIQKIDYSEANEIIKGAQSNEDLKYYTDNKREVYSKGGITPDTSVSFTVEGNITKELLASGYFFKFANHYNFKQPELNYSTIKDDKLLVEYKSYLESEGFEYKSQAEIEIENLISNISKSDGKLKSELENIKEELTDLYKNEMKVYREEILREIRTELAARYIGFEGRIEEQLNSDVQVQTALQVLKSNEVYNHLLNVH